MQKLNRWLDSRARTLLFLVLLLQPFLDVASYFAVKNHFSSITTFVRAALFFLVLIFGFVVSEKRRIYIILLTICAVFWFLRLFLITKDGYISILTDTAEYIKLIQLPIWAIVFYTTWGNTEYICDKMLHGFSVNFASIVMIIGFSFLVGSPAYTYEYPERGIRLGLLGWFEVSNAQSAIVSILVVVWMAFAIKSGKLWLFCAASFTGLGLLYATGTRLAFYSAILIAGVYLIYVLIQGRDQRLYCLPILFALTCLVLFFKQSPMYERRQMAANTHAIFQEKTDLMMGTDADFIYQPEEEIHPQIYEKIKSVYTSIYGVKNHLGNPMLKDLIERFGVERVMEVYRYTLDADILYDSRVKRINCCRLLIDEKGIVGKLFGFEYQETYLGENIYDLENDFPAIIFFYGYVGAALYFFFIFAMVGLAIYILFNTFPKKLNVEIVAMLLAFGIALIAAQFSGNVLRKPNVSVYVSVICAALMATALEIKRQRRLSSAQGKTSFEQMIEEKSE